MKFEKYPSDVYESARSFGSLIFERSFNAFKKYSFEVSSSPLSSYTIPSLLYILAIPS